MCPSPAQGWLSPLLSLPPDKKQQHPVTLFLTLQLETNSRPFCSISFPSVAHRNHAIIPLFLYFLMTVLFFCIPLHHYTVTFAKLLLKSYFFLFYIFHLFTLLCSYNFSTPDDSVFLMKFPPPSRNILQGEL
jgi:cellulose synthase/poly-beta-1,6-N-acetylglucosamine synthase-like glycosyltransferase